MSVEKNEHPALVDTNSSILQPEEEHSLHGQETFGKAQKEREEETCDDKEDILKILQMAADEQKSKKEAVSLTDKDGVTLAEKEYASLAEYAEIELPVGRSSPVIQKETRSPDVSSREIRGVLSKEEDDAADDDDEETDGDDEDDMDGEDDSFHA